MKKHIDKIILAGLITAITIVLLVLATLLIRIIIDAWGWIDWQFVTSYPSRKPELSGIKSAVVSNIPLSFCKSPPILFLYSSGFK